MFFHQHSSFPFQTGPTSGQWGVSATPRHSPRFDMPGVACPTLSPGSLFVQNMLPVAAAGVGGWLEQVVPPFLNATLMSMDWPQPPGWPVPHLRMPPMPPMMQGALPGPGTDPSHLIGALQGLCEQNVTDIVVARSDARGQPPLHQLLQRPGDTRSFALPSPAGGMVVGTITRHALPKEDGSWLMEIDLAHSGQRKQSQWIRVHDVRADAGSSRNFLDDMGPVFDSFSKRLDRGEHAQMATFCEDGATASGAAIALMHVMGRQRSLRQAEREGQPIPDRQARKADMEAVVERAREQRGPAFAQGQEGLLDAALSTVTSPPVTPSPFMDEPVPEGLAPPLQPVNQAAATPLDDKPMPRRPAPQPPSSTPQRTVDTSPAPSAPSSKRSGPEPVGSRKRAAPDPADAPPPKRPFISQSALTLIRDEQAAIQRRQVERAPNAPRTAIGAGAGAGAGNAQTKAQAADTERALVKARQEHQERHMTAGQMSQAAQASVPLTDDEADLLASLSDVDLPGPMPGAGMARSNSAPELRAVPPSASGVSSTTSAAPTSVTSSTPALARASSEPDLRPPGLAGSIAALEARAPALLDALMAPAPGVLARAAGRLTGRDRVDVEQQLVTQLQPLVTRLRAAHRAAHGRTGTSGEEETFVVNTLHAAFGKAARRLPPSKLDDMAARVDARGGAFRRAEAHAAKQRDLAIELALSTGSQPQKMRMKLLDEAGLLTYVLSGVRSAVMPAPGLNRPAAPPVA